MVRDDVVQLAGDPLALVAHRPLGLLVALSLQALRAFLQRARVQAADPRRVAEQPRDDQDQLRLDERQGRRRDARPPHEHEGEEGCGQRRGGERRPAVDTLADGVDRDEDAQARRG